MQLQSIDEEGDHQAFIDSSIVSTGIHLMASVVVEKKQSDSLSLFYFNNRHKVERQQFNC